MGEQAGDKTEEPTPHKLQEARKKGQVAKSKEITTAALLLLTYKVFEAVAPEMWYRILDYGQFMWRQVSTAKDMLDLGYSAVLLNHAINTLLMTMLPIFLVIFFTAVIVENAQTQFLISSESMKPKLEKLDPLAGLKRIFSMKGFIQILITILKIIIVAWIVWGVIKKNIPVIITALNMDPWTLMLFVGGLVMTIAMKVGGFYIGIAILDYLWQKQEFQKSMKMTKQEVKEEYKRLEGDPVIKQAQRQKQREASQRRQQGNVPNADVVVTNPIHLACAIRYDPEVDKAPLLLAKGQRLQAEEIKRIAEENFIPIVENEPLAQQIFHKTEPGDAVPPELYRAVAEVLAFVYKLGRNKGRSKNKPVVNRH